MIDYARELIGVPFLHQGRSMKGMDCCGVLAYVFQKMGLEYVDYLDYSDKPRDGHLREMLDKQPHLVESDSPDVYLMRFAGVEAHLAINAGRTIIHSYKGLGRVTEHTMNDKWKSRITRGYKIV